MKSILLVGANGFLGKKILQTFKNDFSIIGLINTKLSTKEKEQG